MARRKTATSALAAHTAQPLRLAQRDARRRRAHHVHCTSARRALVALRPSTLRPRPSILDFPLNPAPYFLVPLADRASLNVLPAPSPKDAFHQSSRCDINRKQDNRKLGKRGRKRQAWRVLGGGEGDKETRGAAKGLVGQKRKRVKERKRRVWQYGAGRREGKGEVENGTKGAQCKRRGRGRGGRSMGGPVQKPQEKKNKAVREAAGVR